MALDERSLSVIKWFPLLLRNFYDQSLLPFLPWVGGKRSVADYIIPTSLQGYEPFLGGGALFFRVKERFRKHALSDINLRLTTSYNVVKKAPEAAIAKLKEHEEKDLLFSASNGLRSK